MELVPRTDETRYRARWLRGPVLPPQGCLTAWPDAPQAPKPNPGPGPNAPRAPSFRPPFRHPWQW
jgi:hypothetical protein